MNTQRLSLILALAMGCTPRAGGGGYFDPDASASDDVVSAGDAPVTGDDTPVTGDVPVTVDDVPMTACTGDKSCGAGRFCEAGMCRAQVCTPGSATCVGATAIALCDPRGAARAEMPCPGGAGCADGRCQSPRVCEPGAAMCEGSAARRVCTPDGTSYMTVACAGGERCTDGACMATQVCAPGSASCGADGQRRVCNESGTGYTSMSCGSAPNATLRCQGGACAMTCAAGFANCDGDGTTGCEANLASASNCGACGNACAAGQSCVSGTCTGGGGPTGNFRVNGMLTTGCSVVDHSAYGGDDRGPIAALNGYLLVSGDTATVSVNTSTRTMAVAPLRIDWYTSNVRTGQLVVFAAGAQPLPIDSGGMATHIAIVDPATALPVGAPIALSQGVRIGPGAGFFAGWDRAVVWDTGTLWDINLTNGAVRSLGTWSMPTHAACELGGLWGVAETEGSETNLVYVSSSTTISRVRVSTRAVSTVGTFSNLGDMCGISVLPSANRWFFHHEGASQFHSTGNEVAGWCAASFSTSGITCPAPEIDCGGTCVNTQSSAAHCGRCGNACASGQSCNAGVCATASGGYTRSTPALSWVDACTLPGSTRVLPGMDDGNVTASLPFSNFLYWGRRVTSVNIATNGFISLDGVVNADTGGTLPAVDAPNAVVAPWWTDLRTAAGGVCYATSGSAGARSFIVQWNAANYYATSAGELSFQVRLNESGNTIDFVYSAITTSPMNYFPAVGIENWEGTRADSVCAGYNAMTRCTQVTSTSRFRFTPN